MRLLAGSVLPGRIAIPSVLVLFGIPCRSDGNYSVSFMEIGLNQIDVDITQIGGYATSLDGTFILILASGHRVLAVSARENDLIDASQLLFLPTTLEGGQHHDTLLEAIRMISSVASSSAQRATAPKETIRLSVARAMT